MKDLFLAVLMGSTVIVLLILSPFIFAILGVIIAIAIASGLIWFVLQVLKDEQPPDKE